MRPAVRLEKMRSLAVSPGSLLDTGLAAAARAASGTAKRIERQRDQRRVGRRPPSIGDALRDGHTLGWQGVECAFALSTGRAGSKTLTGLWALSPRVKSVHEPLPRQIEVSARAWRDPAAPDLRSAVYAARDDLVADAWRRGLVWAETNNRLTSLAPALAGAFPAARFVHLWRDPEAFLASGLARRWYAGHHWDFARWQPRPDDPVAEVWPALPAIDRIAWLWAATNGFIADFGDEHPDRFMVIAADAMFAGDAEAMAAVYRSVGVTPPRPAAIRRVLARQINAGSGGSGVSASWFDGLSPPVRDLVGAVAERLGARVR